MYVTNIMKFFYHFNSHTCLILYVYLRGKVKISGNGTMRYEKIENSRKTTNMNQNNFFFFLYANDVNS